VRQQLDTAIRLSLAGQVRNRLAWVLLIVFVPVWYLLIGSMIPHAGTGFRLRATGAALVVDGHDLTLITAGLSAITLITGFVVFAAVRRSGPFDRRLVLSGYRPAALIAAKTGAALVQAVAVGAYAAIIMQLFWRPAAVWSIAVTFMLAAATYAAFGLLIGVCGPGRPGRLLPDHHDLHAGHIPGEPGRQSAGEQGPAGVLSLLSPDPVRRRRSLPPPGAGQHDRTLAGLDGRLRPARADSALAAHAAASARQPPARRRAATSSPDRRAGRRDGRLNDRRLDLPMKIAASRCHARLRVARPEWPHGQ
jgi:hypothetical protein